jgi:tetratricopeptide (TPR) repeat protein
MNKKMLFLSAGIMMATVSFAQKDKLKEASKELEKATTSAKEKPDEAAAAYQKGKAAIDAAVSHPDTKDKPETWLTKAGIYIGMQENPKLNADNPYREGIAALKKAIELNKKLESDQQVVNLLANGAFYSYNDGINTYNKSKFPEAYALFKDGQELLGPDKDKRFILMPVIDTIRTQSRMFMGLVSYYDSDNGKNTSKINDAITVLEPLKNSAYLSPDYLANIYIVLAQSYEKKGDKEKQLAAIKEAKQKFPNDQNIDALEVNYALEHGTQGDAIKKMEEAIAKNPSNPELQLNLGILYATLAKPAGGAAPPANAAEYRKSAEAAYQKAISMAPDNGTYNYQLGSYYFNQAADIITVMNNLGNSKEDQRQYTELNKQKDDLFAKALPLLEKSRGLFEAKGKLGAEEQKSYYNCLTGLKEIYVRMDQTDKAAEIRTKINALSK